MPSVLQFAVLVIVLALAGIGWIRRQRLETTATTSEIKERKREDARGARSYLRGQRAILFVAAIALFVVGEWWFGIAALTVAVGGAFGAEWEYRHKIRKIERSHDLYD